MASFGIKVTPHLMGDNRHVCPFGIGKSTCLVPGGIHHFDENHENLRGIFLEKLFQDAFSGKLKATISCVRGRVDSGWMGDGCYLPAKYTTL